MEWDEVRLLPAELLLTSSGVAALLIAFSAAIDGQALALVFVAIAAILLVAGGVMGPARRWSIRFGSLAAGLAAPVWLVALVALDRPDDPTIGVSCLALAACAVWASRFLRDELRPPEWLRTYEETDERNRTVTDGWIEDLPTTAVFSITDSPRLGA